MHVPSSKNLSSTQPIPEEPEEKFVLVLTGLPNLSEEGMDWHMSS
jgi:hypothetical protein